MNKRIIILVAVLLLGGGIVLLTGQLAQSGQSETMISEKEARSTFFQGTVLAGTTAPYLDFANQDYLDAVQSGKLILLNFYANWCPICRAEAPEVMAGFTALTSDQIIGFRVNFNDSETDQVEKELAKRFKVPYQHTKVVLKNGIVVYRATEAWDKEKTITTLTSKL